MSEPEQPAQDDDSTGKALSFRSIDKFIDVQSQEVNVRYQEARARRMEIQSNERIALASIAAKSQDRTENRIEFNKHLIHRYCFVAGVLILLFVFAGVAIWLGAKDLVSDIFKMGGGLLVGAFGGYHAGRSRAMMTKSQDSE